MATSTFTVSKEKAISTFKASPAVDVTANNLFVNAKGDVISAVIKTTVRQILPATSKSGTQYTRVKLNLMSKYQKDLAFKEIQQGSFLEAFNRCLEASIFQGNLPMPGMEVTIQLGSYINKDGVVCVQVEKIQVPEVKAIASDDDVYDFDNVDVRAEIISSSVVAPEMEVEPLTKPVKA